MIVQEMVELRQNVETLRMDNERMVAELERCDRKVANLMKTSVCSAALLLTQM